MSKTTAASSVVDEKNTGSPEFQATTLTSRITHITEHLKTNKKDNMARRGLLQMVGQRKRVLKYLASKDGERYKTLVKELGLRK